ESRGVALQEVWIDHQEGSHRCRLRRRHEIIANDLGDSLLPGPKVADVRPRARLPKSPKPYRSPGETSQKSLKILAPHRVIFWRHNWVEATALPALVSFGCRSLSTLLSRILTGLAVLGYSSGGVAAFEERNGEVDVATVRGYAQLGASYHALRRDRFGFNEV